MNSFWPIQSLIHAAASFDSPDPLQTLENEWTPLFSTGVLVSKTSWLGHVVSFGWQVAHFFRWGDEHEEIQRIIHIVQRAMETVLTGSNPSRELVAATYIPECAHRIQKVACVLLHCSSLSWEQACHTSQPSVAVEIFENMTALPPPQAALCASRESCARSVREQYAVWMREFKKSFPRFVSSTVVWDAVKEMVHEHFPRGDVDQESARVLLKLHARGVPLDSFVDKGETGLIAPSFQFSLADGRFSCFRTSSTDYMLVHAANGFLIPLWRMGVHEKDTLIPVVRCYEIHSTKKSALIEGLEGPLYDVVKARGAFPGLLCLLERLMSCGCSCTLSMSDLWVARSGDIVSFAPCFRKPGVFSLASLEQFVRALPGSENLMRAIRFFSQKEIRALEQMFMQQGCFVRDDELKRTLLLEGISVELFPPVRSLLQTIRGMTPSFLDMGRATMVTYVSFAEQEGCFFFPSERLLQRLSESMSHTKCIVS